MTKSTKRKRQEIVRKNGTVLKCYQKKDRCTCRKCMDGHNERKRASYAFNKTLYDTLVVKLGLTAADIPVLRSLVSHLEGTPLKHCARAREHKKLLQRIAGKLDSPFRECWRFQECEREPTFRPSTAIFDHTEIELVWKDDAYKSRKGFGYTMKFLCAVTMQGAIIRVVGPFPGRMHDFQTCKFPAFDGNLFHAHFSFERWLADGGYVGVRGDHVLVPHKKPPKKPMPQGDDDYNKDFAKLRARVEHTFACFKGRFRMFASPIREKDPIVISQMFKLAAMIHGLDTHAQNKTFSKYRTCNNIWWREHDHHPDYTAVYGDETTASGEVRPLRKPRPCNCRSFPSLGDASEKIKEKYSKAAKEKKAAKLKKGKSAVKIGAGKKILKK